jgi:uncharacterized protein YeaO (DUF488 family)
MDFEIILNKIVDITEKNLQIQSEFIKAIYELKHKLHDEKATKDEIKQTLKTLDENIDEIYEIIGKVSNQEIITLLYTFRDDKNNFSHMLKNYLEKFEQTDVKINRVLQIEDQLKSFKVDFKDLKEKVIFASNIHKIVIAVVTALTLITGSVQYIRSMEYNEKDKKLDFLIKKIELLEEKK